MAAIPRLVIKDPPVASVPSISMLVLLLLDCTAKAGNGASRRLAVAAPAIEVPGRIASKSRLASGLPIAQNGAEDRRAV
jgi:hypothetical protein